MSSNLLTSKSRLAPIKTLSITRLELSAAELLSRLAKAVKRSMEWTNVQYFLWTDSSATYYWIKREPCTLKIFAANRVASIQENTEISRWRHINGKDNPADLITRGVSPTQLVNNQLWLHGPSWLILPPQEWPPTKVMSAIPQEALDEINFNALTVFKEQLRIGLEGKKGNVPLLEYTAKLEKAVNIISYVKRFIRLWLSQRKGSKCQRKRRGEIIQKVISPTNREKAQAMEYLLRKAQQEYYNREITALESGEKLPEKCKVNSLNPVLDTEGILRVGGRIGRSELNYEMKYPAIIPNGSRLAWLVIDNAHRRTNHGSTQIMLQFIRQHYWIPKIRNELRNYVRKCVVCARLNAQMEDQLMSELPSERVQVGKPFLHSGVDYAGPFELILPGASRELPRRKCWVAVFVCLKSRAIHLDIVSDLTSIAFIACYERFIARRGRCEKIFSDNGTTFVGTEKELKKAVDHWISKETLDQFHQKGTEWQFMTPAAPHQGGIYEAAVKSMKFHLKRIIGQKVLTYERFLTLLHQIEAILNSRPLHPLSDDPLDIQALTPGHFFGRRTINIAIAVSFGQ